MDFSKFTVSAQKAVQEAQQMANSRGNQFIETGHILKGIINVDLSVLPYVLEKFGVNKSTFNQTVDRVMESYPKVSGASTQLSRFGSQALVNATKISGEFGDEFVAIEHLLLGIYGGGDSVAQLLKDVGIQKKELEEIIMALRKGEKVRSSSQEETYNALSKYAIFLNEMARDGKLDPVIGRDEEIRRVIQILSRRTKNNPILIGEPGVGKTAIAEGIAHRIINGDVPENLKSKLFYSLDMGALIAGAKFKGEFEERLKAVVKEVVHSDGEIVLFIDEIHTLVGAGGGQGAMDAANILKPALARGELRAVGATTLDEYQKYFEKDKALERRFQKVMVHEPTTEDTISILRGLREKYEIHHKVQIRDEAILNAVELSQRYITDRFLPDKAIDLIDEAASKLRMEINSKPQELDEIERKLMQLEIEREAIKREHDQDKLSALNREIAEITESRSTLAARWRTEKETIEAIQKSKQQIEDLKLEAEQAERDGNYELVAEIRYSKMSEAEQLVEISKQRLTEIQSGSKMIKEEVDAEEIADVVSKWTGIPISKMVESERSKLLRLEEELQKRIVGQENAIEAISDAVRRSRAGLQDGNRPIGSFIFLGTTGVGKTELAKALSDFLFNSDTAMTRIDMSEYQERHSISRLVGAPPGYVGHDEGGQLTEAVRRKPYSVVLLDEIEKAHPDVFNTLLQVLDDGRLTDGKGREVNFKNTIIIMTSNLGAHIIRDHFQNLDELNDLERVQSKTRLEVFELLKQTVRPEFLNRVDEVIMFQPLSREGIREIVRLQIGLLDKIMKNNGIELTASDDAIDWFVQLGYDPQFGARPVKRVIQRKILNELSKKILAGEIQKNSVVVVDVFEGHVVFREQSAKA